MKPPSDDDLSRWEVRGTSAFPTEPVAYIPNPEDAALVKKGDPISTLLETPDWGSFPMVCYMHKLTLRGQLSYNGERELNRNGLSLEGMRKAGKCGTEWMEEEDGWKKYQRSCRYIGECGEAYLLWNLKLGRRGEERPHDLKLVLVPTFRQELWASVQWAQRLIEDIEERFCFRGLYVNQIELPIDIESEGLNARAIERCIWRGYGKSAILRPDREGDNVAAYDARNGAPRKIKVYMKEGHLHIEPTWEGRAFTRRKGYSRFNAYSVLLYMLSLYGTMSLRYLDHKAASRSRMFGRWADGLWRIFVGDGIQSVPPLVKKKGLLKSLDPKVTTRNLHRIFSEHPLNPYFKKCLASVIAKGLKLTYAKTKDAGLRSPSDINAMLADRSLRSRLKRRLVLRSVYAHGR